MLIARPVRNSDHQIYKCVRRVKNQFQARFRWADGPDGDCSIGLYPTSRDAVQARRAVARHLDVTRPVSMETIWLACLKGMASGRVNPRVLPKYVRAVPSTAMFIGTVKRRGRKREFTKEFADPWAAHLAAVALRQRLVGA